MTVSHPSWVYKMPRQFKVALESAAEGFDAAVRNLITELAPTVTYSGIELRPNPNTTQAFENMAYQVSGFFLGMPQTPNSRKHTENIYLIGLLNGVVVNKAVQLKSYATEVSYCRMQNLSNQYGEQKAMAGYHFDFESTASKINHPIFHVQQSIKAGSRFFEFNNNFDLPEFPNEHPEIRTLRIPTPQMDIFSAIVMILADHIVPPDESGEPFANFLSAVHQNLLPINFDNSPIDVPNKFLAAHPMHIHDWYPVNLG